MQRRTRLSPRLIALAFVTLCVPAQAATLRIVDGELMGASGVMVDGEAYDVEFRGGTCIAVFGGCEDASNFTFKNTADANRATEALLDQVFLDTSEGLFDSVPTLTNGCTGSGGCSVSTLFSVLGVIWYGVGAQNIADPNVETDFIRTEFGEVYFDSAGIDRLTFAVWTPVPEPSTALLLGLGLGLASLGAPRRN